MSGRISKLFKWGVSALRVAKVRVVAGSRMKVVAGKPLYLGKGARIVLGEGASFIVGSGVYLSPGCVVQVGDGASLELGDGVYMNEGCRVTVVESARIGADTLFGPNVQIYDHDHEFDRGGCAWSCAARLCQLGDAAGCAPTPLSRAAARLRTARSCRRTPSSRGILPKLMPCTLARQHV